MKVWAAQEDDIAPPFIISLSPTGYLSPWLHPRIARFRFARQNHCRSAASCGLNFRFACHATRAMQLVFSQDSQSPEAAFDKMSPPFLSHPVSQNFPFRILGTIDIYTQRPPLEPFLSFTWQAYSAWVLQAP